MKVIAIIQARMASNRLPGKVLLPLQGKRILQIIVERIKRCSLIGDIIIATTSDPTDDLLENVCNQLNYKCFRGSQEDVMDRMMGAVLAVQNEGLNDSDFIVEITGDCPLVDPALISPLILELKKWDFDCATNVYPQTWPDGLDILVYPVHALKEINNIVNDPILRHHVGWNMLLCPDRFNIYNLTAPPDLEWPELGLTLDTPDDYNFLQIITKEFPDIVNQRAEDIIRFLRVNPSLIVNKNVRRKMPEEG